MLCLKDDKTDNNNKIKSVKIMPISQQKTMTATAVKPLLRFIKQQNIPLSDALQGSNLSESKLDSERLSINSFDQVINNIARISQQEDIGFIAGQGFELESFSLLGFLISNCRTGRDALVTMRRYYMLLSDTPAPEIFITKNEVKVLYHVSAGNELATRARAELIATSIHTSGCALGGQVYQLLKIGFKHSKPKYHNKLENYFNVDISYNQAQCSLSFAAEHVDEPLNNSNPIIYQALRNQTDKLLSSYLHLSSNSAKVLHVLQQWPNQYAANKESVAELLNTSPRTLTRRLQEENTQFSHLLRDVRMEKARLRLESYAVDMQALAHELGFADRRGFERAFKQWSNQTPSAYHKQWKNSAIAATEV
jgi:AraC-like DNA-binding protein